MRHEWIGTMCVLCGLTRGRASRAYSDTGIYPSCDRAGCGHPLAARRIIRDDSTLPIGLRTDCWACAVQREIVSKIVGPRASKRRADGA